jgi:hypothetical protein
MGLNESKRDIIGFNRKPTSRSPERSGVVSLIAWMAEARKPDRTHIAP